jgi:hypothetical protein
LGLKFTVFFRREAKEYTSRCIESFDQLIFQKGSAKLPSSDFKIPFPCNEKRKLTAGIKKFNKLV